MRKLLLALVLAACAAPPAPDPWTLDTIDSLKREGDPAITFAGSALKYLSNPYPTFGSGIQTTANNGLTIFPAFAEGKTAAYITTEYWYNFDEIWVQPAYVSTTFQKTVFGVDQTTRFYSPLWQIFYYTPPDGEQFTSETEILESGVQLTPGPGVYWGITQDPGIASAVEQGDAAPIRPLTGETVGLANNFFGYADGHPLWFIDVGLTPRFTWNAATQVIDETPLYRFTLEDATHNPLPLDLPQVGGSGPPHHPNCDGHGNCSLMAKGVPQFGALWRIYEVMLPNTADVYVPPDEPSLIAEVKSQGFPAATPPFSLGKEYTLRVALNGTTCFAAGGPACIWLDSQNAIEGNVADWRITRTGTLASCPLLLFNGKAIGSGQ